MKARINRGPMISEPKNLMYNREQRRQIAKIYDIPMSKVTEMLAPRIKDIIWEKIIDDSTVKLKYDDIMLNKKDKSEAYLQFVEEHKDQELTAYQDEEHKGSNLYCVREDKSQSPWLFDISELSVIKMKDVEEYVISNE